MNNYNFYVSTNHVMDLYAYITLYWQNMERV